MAKQTFTSGQVLSAAQMTSLQQTAMGGGSATAKTASYVLVAADAGCTILMNAAGATTITVNTGLFAAGDTVFIQNIGAGVCTITAGTATVNTAGSLALSQYEGADLYFTATGAAILNDYTQTAGASGGMTLISTTSLTGSTVSITSIPGTYNALYIIADSISLNGNNQVTATVNAASGPYPFVGTNLIGTANIYSGSTSSIPVSAATNLNGAATVSAAFFYFPNYATTTSRKIWQMVSSFDGQVDNIYVNIAGSVNSNTAITSFELRATSGNFDNGTISVYGVK